MMYDLITALKRLKVETGSLVCLGCGHEHNCSTRGCAILREAIDTLVAYEDTGLTPEEVAEYKKFEDEAISKNVPFARIVELMNAEAEGRLIVLPFQLGQRLYRVFNGEIEDTYTINRINVQVNFERIFVECMPFLRDYWKHGKFTSCNIFLTREEAEAALGRTDNG